MWVGRDQKKQEKGKKMGGKKGRKEAKTPSHSRGTSV
jgi:hypothetical protein